MKLPVITPNGCNGGVKGPETGLTAPPTTPAGDRGANATTGCATTVGRTDEPEA